MGVRKEKRRDRCISVGFLELNRTKACCSLCSFARTRATRVRLAHTRTLENIKHSRNQWSILNLLNNCTIKAVEAIRGRVAVEVDYQSRISKRLLRKRTLTLMVP